MKAMVKVTLYAMTPEPEVFQWIVDVPELSDPRTSSAGGEALAALTKVVAQQTADLRAMGIL